MSDAKKGRPPWFRWAFVATALSAPSACGLRVRVADAADAADVTEDAVAVVEVGTPDETPDASVADAGEDATNDVAVAMEAASPDAPDVPDVPDVPDTSRYRYAVASVPAEFASPDAVVGNPEATTRDFRYGNCPLNPGTSGRQMPLGYLVFDVLTEDGANFVRGHYNNYCSLMDAATGSVTLAVPLIGGGMAMGQGQGAAVPVSCPTEGEAVVGFYGVVGRLSGMPATGPKRVLGFGLVCAAVPAWVATGAPAATHRSTLAGITAAQMASARDVEMHASLCDRDRLVVGFATASDTFGVLMAIKPTCASIVVTR